MNAIAQVAADGIVSCMALGLVIAMVAWTLTRVLPAGKAGFRFAVWFSALSAIALAPLVQNALRARAGFVDSATVVPSLLVLPANWATYLFVAWAVTASLGLARVTAGAWQLRKLRSNSRRVELSELDQVARETVERVVKLRAFEVRTSDHIHVPMAIGFFRPAVVFPTYLLGELSADQMNQLLLHETTHLLRYDDWTNLLQKVMQAVLFFHPAVWWLDCKLALEREMACDEAVVAETADPHAYAECLTVLAEKTVLRRSLGLVQAAVSRLRQTSLRVTQLLAAEKARRGRTWGAVASVVGVLSTPQCWYRLRIW